jgi:N-acetylneuraminic acid mutarotase
MLNRYHGMFVIVLVTALLGLFSPLSMMQASPSGTWSPAGSLITARARHESTLLLDGRVLVTGGLTTGAVTIASAELYSPITGVWSSAGSMSTRRSRHTATLLADGRVLVVGGRSNNGGPSLASAELYNPFTNTWSPTGSMSTSRDNHRAIRLNDGRVLVVGGVSGDGGVAIEKSAEIYNPQTGTWTSISPMAEHRYLPTVTLLVDGRVLVAGGYGPNPSHVPLKTTEIYDPQTDQWTNVDPMFDQRATHSVVPLPDGRVLAAGGWTLPANVFTPDGTSEIFNPVTGRWSRASNMVIPRGALGNALTLRDGRVFVAGGIGSGYLASAEIYDPATGVWSLTGSMATARTSEGLTILGDGTVMIAGGGNDSGALATCEIYTP